MDNFDPNYVFLAIATNIPQRLKTGFVVQGHIFLWRPINPLYSVLMMYTSYSYEPNKYGVWVNRKYKYA